MSIIGAHPRLAAEAAQAARWTFALLAAACLLALARNPVYTTSPAGRAAAAATAAGVAFLISTGYARTRHGRGWQRVHAAAVELAVAAIAAIVVVQATKHGLGGLVDLAAKSAGIALTCVIFAALAATATDLRRARP
jgi:peptidoglycan/LPS O-acetylase OafA/YrhL